MLYVEFEGHQPSGFREDIQRVLPYMGMAAIWVTWTNLQSYNP